MFPHRTDPSRRRNHLSRLDPTISTIFALLVGTAWLYSGWLENAAYYYAPIVAVFLLTSLIAGIIQSRSNRRCYCLLAGGGSCLLAVATLLVPYVLAWSWYRMEAAQYPLPADAWKKEAPINPIQWNRQSPWAVQCKTSLPFQELKQFYIRALREEGMVLQQPAIGKTKYKSRFIVNNGGTRLMLELYRQSDDERRDGIVFIGPMVTADEAPPEYLVELLDRINSWQ